MTDEDRPGRPEPAVTVAEDGTRRISWSRVGSDGVTWTFEHDHPDALRHHYAPLGIDEDVPLYRGMFCLDDDDRPFRGDVRFRWLPTPHVEARGSRETAFEDLHRLFATEPGTLWVDASTVRVSHEEDRLPAQPPADDARPQQQGHSISSRIEQELGSRDGLDRVTFLLPNGWQAHDGLGICDPDDLSRLWSGSDRDGLRRVDGDDRPRRRHGQRPVARPARQRRKTLHPRWLPGTRRRPSFHGAAGVRRPRSGSCRAEPGVGTAHDVRATRRLARQRPGVDAVAQRAGRPVRDSKPLA